MGIEKNNKLNKMWQALARKRVDDDDSNKERMARVMGLFDLTALGLGATLGLGIYVLAGSVAKENAGPAVCISFLIAAIASVSAGMCYAEFASRVPKSGSAYVYSYVTVGEFIAFVIGWNLILEYVIGTASCARAFSNYIDYLLGDYMKNALKNAMPMNVPYLSEYPDFFAFGVVVFMTIMLSIGVRESSIVNNIFTALNLITISIIIVAGVIKADPKNWSIQLEDIKGNFTKDDVGQGGFLPFGWSGVFTGAAECFYGFVGFDTIATTSEEAKNPQRNIPYAIVISLGIVCVAYFGISTVLTMMWPYYDQNPAAPFPHVFHAIEWDVVGYIVNAGAIFALCTALIGVMFPLPRILYAMGNDGVIFRFLAKINPRTKTPVLGTVVAGALTGIMTLLFDIKQLIEMSSIGTLLAYAIVAVCVLILRYQGHVITVDSSTNNPTAKHNTSFSPIDLIARIFNLHQSKEPTPFSGSVAKWGVAFFSTMSLIFGLLINYLKTAENQILMYLAYVLLGITTVIIVLTILAISRQPVQDAQLSFKVPFVPILPCCSIFMNIYLMLQLNVFTWIRLAVWLIFGFGIYFMYGITHSSAAQKKHSTKLDEEL